MSKKTKIIIISAISAFVLILASLSAFCIYKVNAFEKSNVIASNVEFCGINIGGKTMEQAKQLINESQELPGLKPITVQYEDKEFAFAPDMAGLQYNTDTIVKNAYAVGRGKSFFSNLWVVMGFEGKTKVTPVYFENKADFKNTINNLASEAEIKFENYKVELTETYADIEIFKDKKKIDYDKLLSDTYSVMDKKDAERKVTLVIVDSGLPTADEIYDSIYVEPRNARADNIDGQINITPHQVGVLINKEEIAQALLENKDKFRISVTKKYPEIKSEDLSGDLFNDVLGTLKTTYNAGIVGRTRNVTLAAQKINGVILNPGEIFSYNNVVGPRTSKTGFSTATVYTAQGLKEELGGGICQVSSTLYNAALYADLEIVERRNHMYTVAYVKNGLDATVAYGTIDFRFKNNKQNPIKIVAVAEKGVLTVSILGKKENDYTVELYTNTVASYGFTTEERVVETMAPGESKVVQKGSYGYKINATKVVKDASGNVIRNEFLGSNVYKPLTKIIEKGPDAIVEPENPENTGEQPENTEENPPASEGDVDKPEETTGEITEGTNEEQTEGENPENEQATNEESSAITDEEV